MILWSIHIADGAASGPREGDLVYNDKLIVSQGEYVGDRRWPELVKQLKTGAGTSVKRVEVSVGSYSTTYDSADWVKIKRLINEKDGDQENSVLHRNFKALFDVLQPDAINSDDETCYDVESTLKFAQMAKRIGYPKFTFVPFERKGYWADVRLSLGDYVDRVYLQCYAGGDVNANKEAIDEWSDAMSGLRITPGLWCRHGDKCAEDCSPTEVHDLLTSWRGAKIAGGFIWYYDDIRKCARTGFTAKDYAEAVTRATADAM
ncbi:lysyl endopeptidase [Actinokineospora sp. NPDC004072]